MGYISEREYSCMLRIFSKKVGLKKYAHGMSDV